MLSTIALVTLAIPIEPALSSSEHRAIIPARKLTIRSSNMPAHQVSKLSFVDHRSGLYLFERLSTLHPTGFGKISASGSGALAEWLRRLTRMIFHIFSYQILSGARVRISWASTSFLFLRGNLYLLVEENGRGRATGSGMLESWWK